MKLYSKNISVVNVVMDKYHKEFCDLTEDINNLENTVVWGVWLKHTKDVLVRRLKGGETYLAQELSSFANASYTTPYLKAVCNRILNGLTSKRHSMIVCDALLQLHIDRDITDENINSYEIDDLVTVVARIHNVCKHKQVNKCLSLEVFATVDVPFIEKGYPELLIIELISRVCYSFGMIVDRVNSTR